MICCVPMQFGNWHPATPCLMLLTIALSSISVACVDNALAAASSHFRLQHASNANWMATINVNTNQCPHLSAIAHSIALTQLHINRYVCICFLCLCFRPVLWEMKDGNTPLAEKKNKKEKYPNFKMICCLLSWQVISIRTVLSLLKSAFQMVLHLWWNQDSSYHRQFKCILMIVFSLNSCYKLFISQCKLSKHDDNDALIFEVSFDYMDV